MKKILKISLWFLCFCALLVVVFLGAVRVNEWIPDEVEPQSTGGLVADTIRTDTLKIISWNIGYAGLGDDMDFFYDGGKSVRTSPERTALNLSAIITFLQSHADADFILLQEVDLDSKRSYYVNQYEAIRAGMPQFMGWWGLNYVSQYVPIPLFEPIGAVKSGVVLLSRHAPVEVTRLQYPSGFAFPMRMFNLKRCLLSASFRIEGRVELLYLGNTHNTAYDTDSMREKEFGYLRNYLQDKPLALIAGDWNSNPPGYAASRVELDDPNFSPLALRAADFPSDWSFMSDSAVPSARYGYEPYNAQTTTRTTLDFALATSGLKPILTQTIDLNFRNSDHNPVIFTVVIPR